MAIAAGHLRGAPLVPEVTIFFDDVLLRGTPAPSKVHADSYRGFVSPNYPPLATAGVTIDIDTTLVRPPGTGPIRRRDGISDAVTALRLHPGIHRPRCPCDPRPAELARRRPRSVRSRERTHRRMVARSAPLGRPTEASRSS